MTLHIASLVLVICVTASVSLQAQTSVEPRSDSTIIEITKDSVVGLSSPEFPGGKEAWKKFLMKKLKADIPVANKAPYGKFVVIIEFIVGKNGELSAFKPITSHGYGMESEVIRLLEKSPNWKPGTLHGKPVMVRYKQPVTFVVAKE